MCCGNKRSSAKTMTVGGTSRLGGAATFNIGDEGMVLLEYQLPKAGHVTYIGDVTRQTYVFSSLRKRGYVDARDAPALLARIEDRRHAFTLVNEPTPRVVTPPVQQAPPVTEKLATEELIITETVAQAQTIEETRRLPRKPRKPSA